MFLNIIENVMVLLELGIILAWEEGGSPRETEQWTPAGRGKSAALGRPMPWANHLFSKSMNGKILIFLHEVEEIIPVIFVQDQ